MPAAASVSAGQHTPMSHTGSSMSWQTMHYIKQNGSAKDVITFSPLINRQPMNPYMQTIVDNIFL